MGVYDYVIHDTLVANSLASLITNFQPQYLWPLKISFLFWSAAGAGQRCVSCVNSICVQHATTVFTQSAPSGFTPFFVCLVTSFFVGQ